MILFLEFSVNVILSVIITTILFIAMINCMTVFIYIASLVPRPFCERPGNEAKI